MQIIQCTTKKLKANNNVWDPVNAVTYTYSQDGLTPGAEYEFTAKVSANLVDFALSFNNTEFFNQGNNQKELTIGTYVVADENGVAKAVVEAAVTTKASEAKTTVATELGTTKVTKATKKKAAAKVSVTFKKVNGAAKYQVQISTSKKFKKVLVKKTVKKATVTISNKKLKNKKKLYIRIKAVGADKWSKAKKIKIKK